MGKIIKEHTDEFFEELTERYARLAVVRVAMAYNLMDLSTAKKLAEAPLVYNKQLAPDDTELLSVAKENLYNALLRKMEREEKKKHDSE